MIRYKCTVAYIGSLYCGWQTQKHGDSVQEQIEAAISHIAKKPVSVLASGRTDAGVSARGQVFQFDSDLDMSERKMMGALNGFLPSSIHILKVEKMNRMFHVRYCVRKKRYDYCIHRGPYDVFSREYAYQCPYPLDVEKMKEAAQYLIGTHDFTSFNSTPLKETPDQVRTIYSIMFREEGPFLTISYTGRGFLRYMVRMMTAQLLEAGRGRIEPEEVKRILEAKSKTVSRRNAHPEGLTLAEVDYFEVLALTDTLTVREYLPEDERKEEPPLSRLEEEVKERALPRRYALADRHSDIVYGMYTISAYGGVLGIMKQVPEGELKEIISQLKEYQREQKIRPRLVIWGGKERNPLRNSEGNSRNQDSPAEND